MNTNVIILSPMEVGGYASSLITLGAETIPIGGT